MHKRLFITWAIVFMTWIIAAGCSATPGEAAERPAQVDTAKPEACVITPPAQPVACTMQYDPVCGCDGKTYGNACMARGAGVPHSKPGACEGKLNK